MGHGRIKGEQEGIFVPPSGKMLMTTTTTTRYISGRGRGRETDEDVFASYTRDLIFLAKRLFQKLVNVPERQPLEKWWLCDYDTF